MSASRYYLLAYDVDLEDLGTLYVYRVPEEQVGSVRYLLSRDQIPHAVGKDPDKTGLKIYTTDRSSSLENRLGCEHSTEKIAPSEITLNKIVSSAVRLKFLEDGWVSSSSKIYKPDTNKAEPLINNLALRYKHAVRLTVDNLGSGKRIVFIDPTSKIEFTETLDRISKMYPEQSKYILFVKIKETPVSFYLVRDDMAKESYSEVHDKIADVIRNHRGVNISFPKNTREVITAVPKSLKLSDVLRSKIPNLPLSERRVILPLPVEIVTPVGSLENISLFGSVSTLVIPPEDRVRRVKDIVSELGLESLDFRGIRLKIKCNELFSVPPDNLLEIPYSNEELKKLWEWEPVFKHDSNKRRLLLLIRLRSAVKTYSDKCSQAISRIRKELDKRFPGTFDVQYTDASAGLEDLDSVISPYLEGYDEKYVILLYNKTLDKHGNLVGRFELSFAQKGFYPHVIDLSSEGADRDSKLMFKLMSIIKDFAIRVSAAPPAPSPPPELKGIDVIGIDSTIVPLRRSHVYVGVAVILVKSDGNVNYDVKVSRLAGSDVDVLTSVIQDELRRNPRSLIMVNKSSLSMFLENLGLKTLKDTVLVGVTKTHSYSRILARYHDKFVSPSKTNLFVKLTPLYNNEIQISRYLAITTMCSKEGYEAGTIRPVLFNVAGNIKHEIILQYLQRLTYYAPISKLWLPSIPWPLYKADRMCKKINRILKAAGETSISVNVPQEVWRRL